MTGSLRLGLLVSGLLHIAVAAAFTLSSTQQAPVADEALPITLRLAAFQPPPQSLLVEAQAAVTVPPHPQPPAEPAPTPTAEPQMGEPPRSVETEPPQARIVEPPPPTQPLVETAEPKPGPRPAAEAPVRKPVRERPPPRKAAKVLRSATSQAANKPRAVAPQPEPAAALPAAPAVDVRATQHYLAALAARINRSKFYPRVSRRLGEEGRALIGFVIQRDGALTDLRIVESSGHRRLDDAALETVRRVTPFEPIPDVVRRERWPINVPIAFSLRQ